MSRLLAGRCVISRRQRNSNVLLIHCTRSLIQIMVGTSSTITTTQVMSASSRVISIALSRDGTPTPW
jgi:hypothetical protein